MQNDQCQCVGNHTCRSPNRETGEVERLSTMIRRMRIIRLLEENLPAEQEHASEEFIGTGAYANYPYVSTPITAKTVSRSDFSGILQPSKRAVVSSCGASSDFKQLSVAKNLAGCSDAYSVNNAASPSSKATSNIQMSHAAEPLAVQPSELSNQKCVVPDNKSTRNPNPTDVHAGFPLAVDESAGSDQDDILKCVRYTIMEDIASKRESKLTENTSDDGIGNSASFKGSSFPRYQIALPYGTLKTSTSLPDISRCLTVGTSLHEMGPKRKASNSMEGIESFDNSSSTENVLSFGGENMLPVLFGESNTQKQSKRGRFK